MPSKYQAHLRHAKHYEQKLRSANERYRSGSESALRGLKSYNQDRENIEAGHRWAVGCMSIDEFAARLASAYPDAGKDILSLRLHPKERLSWLKAALTSAKKTRG